MRGTGGSKGLMHFRLGGVDNKAQFAQHMASYETRYGCQPFQITPATINLSDAAACASFYSNNSQWDPPHLPPAAAEATRMWFVKAEMGSLGTHISLQSGASITAKRGLIQEQKRPSAAGANLAAAAAANEMRGRNESGCPRRGAVASLGVADLWLLKGKKFDMRVYVLVPSVEPLLVFFRPGHLRVSALSYLPFSARREGGGGGVGGVGPLDGGDEEGGEGGGGGGGRGVVGGGGGGGWNGMGVGGEGGEVGGGHGVGGFGPLEMWITNPSFGLALRYCALRACQKRPTIGAKETYHRGKRDLL